MSGFRLAYESERPKTERRVKSFLKKTGASAFFFAACAGTLFAADAGTTYVEAGGGYANFRRDGHSDHLAVGRITANLNLTEELPIPLVFADLRLQCEYARQYENSEFRSSDYKIGDLEAVVGVSLLDFIKPHVFVGFETQNFEDFSPFSGVPALDCDGWNFGVTYGAGIEFEPIPKILQFTPYLRRSEVKDIASTSCGLNATFWFTLIGVGADVSYRRFHGDADADSWQALVYAAFRF